MSIVYVAVAGIFDTEAPADAYCLTLRRACDMAWMEKR
jgi:hypothetical protein